MYSLNISVFHIQIFENHSLVMACYTIIQAHIQHIPYFPSLVSNYCTNQQGDAVIVCIMHANKTYNIYLLVLFGVQIYIFPPLDI